MDSRIKRIAIVSVMFMIISVLGIVVLLNLYREKQVETEAVSKQEPQASFVNGDMLSQEELKSFLKDDTFFDKETSDYSSKTDTNSLTLQITSVEKDLRVMVLDYLGQLVKGESFFVTLEDVGEYKDLDKDGIIYIGNLAAGDYYVSLNPLDGYSVGRSNVKTTVKDKIEYAVIDDISFLIKSEEEVDAAIEDTEQKGAIEDADKSEVTLAKAGEGDASFGIDVSKWNKEIDWQKVKAAGVDFAIIRCGYRGSSTGSLIEDPYFKQNIEKATMAGVKVGLYFFTQATNEVEAVEEASMALSLAREYLLAYPIFIDTEGAGGSGRADAIDKETRTLVCDAFCQTIEAAGYQAGVYASKNWLNKNLNTGQLADYTIWLAEYKEQPTYDGEHHMWQYTSKGSIDGIEGRVDLNMSYLKQSSD